MATSNADAFKQALGVFLLGGIPGSVDGSTLAQNNPNPQTVAPSDVRDRERLNAPSNFLGNVTQTQILMGTLLLVGIIGAVALLRR